MNLNELVRGVDTVSRQYCEKYDIERNNEWLLLKTQEELGELVQSYLEISGKSRGRDKSQSELKENFENELADVLCLLLSVAKYNEIDIEEVIQKKWLRWL